MSAMLLCRTKKVRIPYFAEDLGIHLYSGEELSYYIYNNAMLIGEDFLDERLYSFLGQELGMEKLMTKLRRWQDQADLAELLLVILQDIHYYDTEELNEFRRRMDRLGRMSQAERMKNKAEYLLQHRRYAGAVLQYDRILNQNSPELQEASFRGSVWKGRGVACARQFRFAEAAENLEKSWNCVPMDDTLRMWYQITLQEPSLRLPEDLLRRIHPDKKKAWEEQLEQAKTQARFLGKGQEAAEWMDKDNIRRAAGLKNLVETWKTEYRRSQDS